MKHLRWICAALLCSAPLRAEQQTSIGYVVSVQGTWTLGKKSKKMVTSWMKVFPTDEATPANVASGALRVLWRNGESLLKLDCSPSAPCKKLYAMPAVPEEPSLFDRLISAATSLLQQDEKRFSIPGKRGGTTGAREMLLATSDGKVNLLPALVGATEDQRVRLVSLPAPSKEPGSSAPEPKPLEATVGAKQGFVVSPLPPGLYRLELRNAYGDLLPAGTESWILVVTGERLPALQKDWTDAANLASTLEANGVPEQNARALLRASLAELSTR